LFLRTLACSTPSEDDGQLYRRSRIPVHKQREELIDTVARRIAETERPHPVRVAIDGVDGAGKSTFADELAGPLQKLGRPVIRASADSFHNPREIRYRRGRHSPE